MVDIFIAYSHEDIALKNELKKFLRPLLREERISLWDDFDIEAGEEWDAKIKERLYGADVVLLLVSSDSLASDYFYGKEVDVSLKRHKKGEAIVAPIILRHCDWINTPIGELEAIPEKGRPVTEWPTRDQAWQDTVTRLRRVVENIENKKKSEAAEAEHFRLFNAAIQTANHLIQKGKWSEAKVALTDALGLFKKGFEPNDELILSSIKDCDEAEKRQELQQKYEARKSLFESQFAQAESLFYKNEWQTAQNYFSSLLNQWEEGFSIDRHLIQSKIDICDKKTQELLDIKKQELERRRILEVEIIELKKAFQKKQWTKAQHLANAILLSDPENQIAQAIKKDLEVYVKPKPDKTKNSAYYRPLLITVALIGIAIYLWQNHFRSSNTEPEQLPTISTEKVQEKGDIQKTSQERSRGTSGNQEIIQNLKTIPELQKFIKENPQSNLIKDAQIKANKLQKEFDQIVNDGNLMMKRNCKMAIEKYKEALKIYPREPKISKIIQTSTCD